MGNKQHTLEFVKRQAKKLKKEKGITHTEALNEVSKGIGFQNWEHCRKALSE